MNRNIAHFLTAPRNQLLHLERCLQLYLGCEKKAATYYID